MATIIIITDDNEDEPEKDKLVSYPDLEEHPGMADDYKTSVVAPRAWTAEEARKLFLDRIRGDAQYWAELPGKTAQERCDGLAFSILCIFDGVTMALPAMDIQLSPHEDDMEFHKKNGENWFEPDMLINDCHLHDLYH